MSKVVTEMSNVDVAFERASNKSRTIKLSDHYGNNHIATSFLQQSEEKENVTADENLANVLDWSLFAKGWKTTNGKMEPVVIPAEVEELVNSCGFTCGKKFYQTASCGTFFFNKARESPFALIYMFWFFEIDDEVDEDRQADKNQYIQNIVAVLKGVKKCPNTKFEKLTAVLCKLAKDLCSNGRDDLYERFINENVEYLLAVVPFQEKSDEIYPAFEVLRIINSGATPTFCGAEVLYGYKFSRTMTQNVTFQQLRHEAAKHIALANDMYSLHQDMKLGKKCNFVLQSEEGTVVQRLAKAGIDLLECEAKLKGLADMFLSDCCTSLPETKQEKQLYIDILTSSCGNHIDWALCCGRYHQMFATEKLRA